MIAFLMTAFKSKIFSLLGLLSNYSIIVFFLILLLSLVIRFKVYHPFSLSIGFNDTNSYLETSQIKFPSWDFFTSMRPPTIPLIYKLLQPANGYTLNNISSPFEGKLGFPSSQRGFDRVVLLQAALSIISWSMLAYVLYRNTSHIFIKLVLAAIIFLFACMPQMAGWDCILATESISFSLFALLIALCIQTAFDYNDSTNRFTIRIGIFSVSILFVLSFWIFTRDINSYLIPLIILFSLPLILLLYKRKSKQLIILVITLVSMAGIFLWQQASFRQSERWLKPFLNNMTTNVFPYPQRVGFFVRQGMPASDSLLSLRGSAEYNGIYDYSDFISWAKDRGLSSYTNFLIATPLWVSLSIYQDTQFIFSENLQPFYSIKIESLMKKLIPFGDLIHPLSSTVIFVNLILLSVIVARSVVSHEARWLTWAWIAGWLFVSSMALMVFGYLGEVRSVIRHSMAGVVPMRLLLWILLGLVADLDRSHPITLSNHSSE